MRPRDEHVDRLFRELVDFPRGRQLRLLEEWGVDETTRDRVLDELDRDERQRLGTSQSAEETTIPSTNGGPEAPSWADDLVRALDPDKDRAASLGNRLDDEERQVIGELLLAIERQSAPASTLVAKTPEGFHESLRKTYGSDADPNVTLSIKDSTTGSPPASGALASPETPRYDVREMVARGGMGEVMRVWDRELRRYLAMKVLSHRGATSRTGKTPSGSTDSIYRFVEEAQIAGRLEHPGVAPVHELGVDEDGRAFFTMQLVKGETLQEAISKAHRGEPGWNRARLLGILLRMSETMAFAHSRGVIHRDLKPSNVMIGRFGETFVMDWGLAKILGRPESRDIRPDVDPNAEEPGDGDESPLMTRDGDAIGTPAFMAPEQARGEIDRLGTHSDVYSMGAILYQAIAGHSPYLPPGLKMSPRTIIARVIDGPPKPLIDAAPDTPPELVAICEKAMSREIEDRYLDMGEFGDDLRAFMDQRVVKAYRSGAFVELRKWVLRNRALASLLVVTLIFVVSGLTIASSVQARARIRIEGINDTLDQRNHELDASNQRLVESNAAINEARRMAEEHLMAFEHMANLRRTSELVEEADTELWPRRPEKVPSMDRWLVMASELVGQLPIYRQLLEELQDQGVETEQGWDFGDDIESAWKHQVFQSLIGDVESLVGAGGLIEDVENRLTLAQRIASETVQSYERQWEEVLLEVEEDPRFDGLVLTPRVGMIPLEPDPETELWEFWLWETGERPERGEQDSGWVIGEQTGMVFVLVPGGTSWIGATTDPAGPNTDPMTESYQTPPVQVELDPFFVSKYEMTQGQWLRFVGENPSGYEAAYRCGLEHPVEQVSWEECLRVLRCLGLEMPTEAQWEHATRAGTTTPWSFGSTASDLQYYGNLADLTAKQSGAPGNWRYESWSDGHRLHAPVGSYRPNPWGLHDVHGNVDEWCRDSYVRYDMAEIAEGDGMMTGPLDDTSRAIRGGTFLGNAVRLRSAHRRLQEMNVKLSQVGIRPVLRVRP